MWTVALRGHTLFGYVGLEYLLYNYYKLISKYKFVDKYSHKSIFTNDYSVILQYSILIQRKQEFAENTL